MECIDEMIMVFGIESVMTFCLLNTWKYRYRSADKNGKQDIDKSDQYMRIYKELSERVEVDNEQDVERTAGFKVEDDGSSKDI
jgi:hypothetical protein